MSTLAIKNIGILVSGDIKDPILKYNAILVENGIIKKIGNEEILDEVQCDNIIDAKGTTVAPGLIDSHTHPVLGDFTPRQNTLGYISGSLHGGVTTMISAGECHTPGRPKDVEGAKALAVLAHKSSENSRPGGVKLHGGALILEKGMQEKDFEELHKHGVWLVGEIGLGSANTSEVAAPMVKWARKYGFKVMMHTGGTSIPGSSTITAQNVMDTDPDIVSHLNGGPTSISVEEVDKLINDTKYTLELVQCGNFKIMKYVANEVYKKEELERIILGNDSPSGTGIIPLGILRSISYIASESEVSAAQALCFATGNTAKAFGLNVGIIEEGKEADFVIMDTPMGSVGENSLEALEAGDLPGVSMVVVDGEILVNKSKNTPPAASKAIIL
ncbi:enamidase [Clostridium pasteurianum DSM 525 = ATCC 6013]|uniref:Amidohydrolase n=1 Tax=Clostridium pasteurianum DSM 525 = ATCC 6013 TaxID=1262449 RepID=A0A0H3IZD7_CLOPA|nr:amidohydrolase family protein [Clostridium pasteurianum]AJA46394.1 enamidase [Clostridium pasteurianum DSM 525 = ATCC 6013]AJA50382.1 enamidase [Clostridium pasteurianum DSM 525 = ATCC 6013]AOZ73831.1 Enamidase [Clostridium pasteurianum DSM 525 = ATCC 6013]AOZ77628.1 Enamidase [Clostridium pasteurianum]ELP60969.1 amidohydrolase [Clostridium pasteurianum DSM 525 = ATCC 6013]